MLAEEANHRWNWRLMIEEIVQKNRRTDFGPVSPLMAGPWRKSTRKPLMTVSAARLGDDRVCPRVTIIVSERSFSFVRRQLDHVDFILLSDSSPPNLVHGYRVLPRSLFHRLAYITADQSCILCSHIARFLPRVFQVKRGRC